MKQLLALLVLTFLVASLYGQSKTIDSLHNILNKADHSTSEEFAVKNQIVKKYLMLNYDSCQHYLNDLDGKLVQLKDKSNLIDYYLVKGEFHKRQGNHSIVDSCYGEAEKSINELEDEKRWSILNYQIAEFLRDQSKYDSSLVHLNIAFNTAQKNDFTRMKGLCHTAYGILYDYKSEFDLAFENYYKAIAIQEKLQDRNDLADTYLSLGITRRSYSFNNEMNEESFEKFVKNIKKALSLVDASENLNCITRANTELGNYYGIKRDFENSIKYLNLAEKNALKLKSNGRLRTVYDSKGNLYAMNGDFKNARLFYKKEEALLVKSGKEESVDMAGLYFNYGYLEGEMGNIASSVINFKRALKLAKKCGRTRMQESLLKNLTFILAKNNKYEEAYQFQKERQTLRDSLINEKNEQVIKELEVKYETEKLEKEKIILEQEQAIAQTNNKRLWSGLGAFSLVFPFVALFAFRENKRKKTEIQLNQELANRNNKIEQANKLLSEKNHEILHRAKNHLTMLSVFMKQEARRVDDPQAKTALLETDNRLQAIAMIDRRLNSTQGGAIDINEYLDELTSHIKQTFPENRKTLELKLQIDSLTVAPEQAVWIGLIVNELMTNSYKYAFDSTPNPAIEINLNTIAEKQMDMTYRDNGSGRPEDTNTTTSKSFGQRLIRNFTEQMNGKMSAKNDNGLTYNFQFNVPKLAGYNNANT